MFSKISIFINFFSISFSTSVTWAWKFFQGILSKQPFLIWKKYGIYKLSFSHLWMLLKFQCLVRDSFSFFPLLCFLHTSLDVVHTLILVFIICKAFKVKWKRNYKFKQSFRFLVFFSLVTSHWIGKEYTSKKIGSS